MPTLQFSSHIQTFKASGHETRLLIVDELSRVQRNVCELTKLVGADISIISNHLIQLREAGISASDKRRMQVYYSLPPSCVLQLFSCVKVVYSYSPYESSESNPG
ncbi:metalloregulator ArsR/SmtB family transcription factor [Desulfovibrio sp. DV]|uniref:ArsR/SmtB family transcription factor n=1 Tax=Desulfovibrio sp. DV TaxID=1844708 RepID=UPI00094B965D|nr:metalloregulator ArsR/SmtB family transcription factor [Desulfovibrio sp. DV]